MNTTGIPWIELARLALVLPRLDPAFNGYRLVQISDIHFGTFINRSRLDRVVSWLNALEPDAIAITGDFISRNPQRHAANLIASLQKLQSVDGVFAVLGNHDHWTDPDAVSDIIAASGIVNLNNAVQPIARAGAVFYLGGVDCTYVYRDRLDLVLKDLPEYGAAVLLAHEPDYADISAATRRFDLQLSGHSHGGQLILPWIGPPLRPPHARKYPVGKHQINGMIQYTNRGLGTSHFRVRINCPAEITLFELSAPET